MALVVQLQRGHAETLFKDDFSTDAYGSTPRWTGYRDDGSTLLGPAPFSSPYYSDWLPSGGINGSGYIFVQHQSGALQSEYLLHTSENTAVSINPEAVTYQSLYVSWEQNQSSADAATRLFAIEVNDAWYVASAEASFISSNQAFLDMQTLTWNPLSVVTGMDGSLTIDTVTLLGYDDLFTGSNAISSLGFYVNMPDSGGTTRTVRFDNLEVTSGLLWGADSTVGGSGVWTNVGTWIGGDPLDVVDWSNHQTAIFGHAGDTATGGTVSLTSNVIVRSLEFYENAQDYVLQGNVPVGTDGVPARTIQISSANPFRSIYLHPDAKFTVGGAADTGLRIYKSGGSTLHIYGGGTMVVDLNGMVRTEGGGNVIVNDGSTVEVKAGGQFNASRDMIIGSALPTFDGAGGDATLIVDGGSSTTRTGGVGGDLVIGGEIGNASVIVKNDGVFTTASATANGVQFAGNGTLSIESGATLYTRKIAETSTSTGESTVRFDGGRVIVNNSPAGTGAAFIGSDIDHVYISSGGAEIDTNGFNVTVAAGLEHDPDGAAVDGGLTKTGDGNLTLTGGSANTFNGVITLKAGRLITQSFESLGDATNAAANFVLDGGTWEHTGGAATSRGITVTANGGTLAGNTAWRIHGQVVGAVDSVLNIAGNAWLSGNNSSTFHGSINVISGEFLVRRAVSLGTAEGGVTVHNGATFSLDHNGTGGGNNDVNDNTYEDALTLYGGATLRTRGANQAGATLNNANSIYAGNIELAGAEQAGQPEDAIINVSNIKTEIAEVPDMIVSGEVSGDGGLRKTGIGRLTVSAENTYTGKTTVEEGEMKLTPDPVFGEASSLASQWLEVYENAVFDTTDLNTLGGYAVTAATLSGGGTYRGDFVIGNGTSIKVGATSTGGQGMSNVTAAGDLTGTLTFVGNLSLDNSNVYLQLGGVTQGTEYDVLEVTGAFSATGETNFIIEWANGYTAALGQSFDLLNWSLVSGVNWNDFDVDANLNLLAADLGDGLFWDTSQFKDFGIITVNAVPEPTRALLMAFACCFLWLRRRR